MQEPPKQDAGTADAEKQKQDAQPSPEEALKCFLSAKVCDMLAHPNALLNAAVCQFSPACLPLYAARPNSTCNPVPCAYQRSLLSCCYHQAVVVACIQHQQLRPVAYLFSVECIQANPLLFCC